MRAHKIHLESQESPADWLGCTSRFTATAGLVQAEAVLLKRSNRLIRNLPHYDAGTVFLDAVVVDRARVVRISVNVVERKVVPRVVAQNLVQVSLVPRKISCSFPLHDRGDAGQLVSDTDFISHLLTCFSSW